MELSGSSTTSSDVDNITKKLILALTNDDDQLSYLTEDLVDATTSTVATAPFKKDITKDIAVETNKIRSQNTGTDANAKYCFNIATNTVPKENSSRKIYSSTKAGSSAGVACVNFDVMTDRGSKSPAPLKDRQSKKIYDVIIIGMGAAGCAAASELCKAGASVLGLEAMDRVGGRVHSVPLGKGVVELGAEWIHGDSGSSVYELAKQARIPVDPQIMSFQVFRSDGSVADSNIINDLINFALATVDCPPKYPEPLGEYLTRRIHDYIAAYHPDLLNDKEFMRQFITFMDLVIDNYESSSSWNEVTTHSQYEDLMGEMHISWGSSGYLTLFEILLDTIDGKPGHRTLDLKLNKEVSQIAYPIGKRDDVVVYCEDGTEYVGRHAIITVSLGVLKERFSTMFVPPLPEYKIAAIDNISFGVVDKIILQFPHAWWPDDVTFFGFMWNEKELNYMKDGYEWVTRIFGASVAKGTKNALTLWTSGRTAKVVEELPEEIVRRKVMQLLRLFMGRNKDIPEATAILRSTWYSNIFTRGSYTFDNLQTPLYPNVRSDLAKPLEDKSGSPRLLFAGEATDPIHFSTVHGAIDSGRREAKRLIPILKSKIKPAKKTLKGKL